MYYYTACNCMMCNLLSLGKSHFFFESKCLPINSFRLFSTFLCKDNFHSKEYCTHQVKMNCMMSISPYNYTPWTSLKSSFDQFELDFVVSKLNLRNLTFKVNYPLKISICVVF